GGRRATQLLEAQAVFISDAHRGRNDPSCGVAACERVATRQPELVHRSARWISWTADLEGLYRPARDDAALHPGGGSGVLLCAECAGEVPGRLGWGVHHGIALEGRARRLLLVRARYDPVHRGEWIDR